MVVLVFAIGATLLLYPIGRSLARATGGAAGLTSWHSPIRSWRRSGGPSPKSVLAFFCLLAVWLAIRLAASTGGHRARFGWAFGSRARRGPRYRNQASRIARRRRAGAVRHRQQAVRWWRDPKPPGLGPWVDAGLAAVLIFVVVNPLLYPNPVLRTVLLFDHRRDEMEQQAIGTPRLAIPDDVQVRASTMFQRTFREWGAFEARSGLPLDAPLVAIGLGVVVFGTWQSIRAASRSARRPCSSAGQSPSIS